MLLRARLDIARGHGARLLEYEAVVRARFAALFALGLTTCSSGPAYLYVSATGLDTWQGEARWYKREGDVVCLEPKSGVRRTICTRYDTLTIADPNAIQAALDAR